MVKRWFLLFCLVALVAASLAGCGGGNEQPGPAREPVELTVSAAASLKDAMEELKTVYAGQKPEVTITYNFAASGPLQRQIEEGAPVDLFISAGQSQMDALAEKGLIVEESRKNLLGNELVLITRRDLNIGFQDLTGSHVGKISIGTPETAPVGKYAKEALVSMDLWDQLQPKLVLAKDVRQVLTYVETGNVDAGLVYLSDAMVGQRIRIAGTAPAGSHKPIVYPMAVIKQTKEPEAAQAFADFLTSDEAARVFNDYGFKTTI